MMPDEYYIDVPFFKAEYIPYYCTEASTKMIYSFFCRHVKISQVAIEKRGARTFEGYQEFGDIGAYNFFKNMGFDVSMHVNPTKEEIKKLLVNYNVPVMLRFRNGDDSMHTVVLVGFKGNTLIIHDPDKSANVSLRDIDGKWKLEKALVVKKEKGCKLSDPMVTD